MKWHHSLYWRIAAGFVACLALLLVVQAMLFVWVVAQSGRTVPNQPPDRLAQAIALDASQAIERSPDLDLAQYIRQEYAGDAQPFFVQLAGGGTIDIGGPFPAAIREDARARLDLMGRSDGGRFGRGGPFAPVPPLEPGQPPPPGRMGPPGSRGGPQFRMFRPAPIIANGQVAGLVIVPPQPRFTFLLGRYAPILAVVALATFVIGALLVALMIFGPARRRLRAVEDAARRLGAGDLGARAPAAGDDEVAAVASAFNAMASDLATRAEALAAADRARRQLLADVSHELTTPVTAMRGYLETLTMPELRLDEPTRGRYLGIIGDETARLERIIGDLLELARLEEGGGALVSGDVEVRQLFERVRARHERASADAGVTIRTAVAAGAEFVRGDRDRLEQALQNLAANALRYAPSGSSIELTARPVEHGVALAVIDAGAGIAPDHLPHVFDRFYKTEQSRAVRHGSGAGGGSGLGLSIVKAIVERHGGAVSVRSEPGRTSFELHIPGGGDRRASR